MDKFIGILGGMGTEATLYFYNTLISFDRADNDQEHLKILLYNNSQIPDRTNYILNETNSPLEELLGSARILENAGADFIVIPCNTAHYFYEEIKRNVRIPVVSIIQEAAIELNSNHKSQGSIGLLATNGTIKSKVYEAVFNNYDLKIVCPNNDEQDMINTMIYNIKMKKDIDLEQFNVKVKEFCSRNKISSLILGCTELSLIQDKMNMDDCNIIDSNSLLAYRTYVYAKNMEDVHDKYLIPTFL